jgi:hypothetical protein
MSANSRPPSQRDPIFGHAGDPRVAASIVLIGIVAALIGGVFMAVGPQLKDKEVRLVGARGDATCESQTWPAIAQRCLVRAKTESPATTIPTKTEEDAKLSPLTATGGAVKVRSAPQEATVAPVAGATPDVGATVGITRSDVNVGVANNEPQDIQQERIVEPRRRPRQPFPFGLPFGFRF